MRFSRILIGCAAATCLSLLPVYADSNPPAARGSKPTTTGKPTTSGKPDTATTTRTSGKPSTSLNPIAAKISSKPNLNAKITAMLPAAADGTTMTLNTASLGFKNQGQFIAALHVSQNLGILFTDLKKQMVTRSSPTADPTQTKSLGQAIQAVKKNADATTEAQKAETQANADLSSTSTTTSASTNTAKKTKKKSTQAGGNQ